MPAKHPCTPKIKKKPKKQNPLLPSPGMSPGYGQKLIANVFLPLVSILYFLTLELFLLFFPKTNYPPAIRAIFSEPIHGHFQEIVRFDTGEVTSSLANWHLCGDT